MPKTEEKEEKKRALWQGERFEGIGGQVATTFGSVALRSDSLVVTRGSLALNEKK